MLNTRATIFQAGSAQLRALRARPTLFAIPKSCRLATAFANPELNGTRQVDLHRRAFTVRSVCREDYKPSSDSIPVNGERTPIGKIEPRLAITFTCTVTDCGHRSTHEFSKRSYTKGIVIIQCPGCKNRHLIADNLSWFTDNTGEPRNIEEIIAAKGGKVKRGAVYSDGLDGETLEIEDAVEEQEDKSTS